MNDQNRRSALKAMANAARKVRAAAHIDDDGFVTFENGWECGRKSGYVNVCVCKFGYQCYYSAFAEQNGIVGSTEIRIYGVEIDDHDAFAAVSRGEREIDGDVCLSAAVVAAYYDKSGFQKVFHWSASADNVAGQGAIHFHIKFHTGVRS